MPFEEYLVFIRRTRKLSKVSETHYKLNEPRIRRTKIKYMDCKFREFKVVRVNLALYYDKI